MESRYWGFWFSYSSSISRGNSRSVVIFWGFFGFCSFMMVFGIFFEVVVFLGLGMFIQLGFRVVFGFGGGFICRVFGVVVCRKKQGWKGGDWVEKKRKYQFVFNIFYMVGFVVGIVFYSIFIMIFLRDILFFVRQMGLWRFGEGKFQVQVYTW